MNTGHEALIDAIAVSASNTAAQLEMFGGEVRRC